MKTVREWIQVLPKDIYDKYINNLNSYKKNASTTYLDSVCNSLNTAISGAFDWTDSPENHNYWSEVSRNTYPKQQTINNNYEIF